jgi:cellulose synthase/poly-beta-1,6-N-acetylglucosamine synthase-like glycosyltransferase
LTTFLVFAGWALLIYYAFSNLVYLVLLLQSVKATAEHHRLRKRIRHDEVRQSPFTPPISILVPARNEEKSITDCVRSLLALDCPEIEVIVVNDGSTDSALNVLRDQFDLVETTLSAFLKFKPVRSVAYT